MADCSIKLPPPLPMDKPLSMALGRRRSSRNYSQGRIPCSVLSTILWACAGQNDATGRRTVPSALDRRSVEVYVIDEEGCWRYDATSHSLVAICQGDRREKTSAGQDFVRTAAVSLLFVADRQRAQGLPETTLALDAGGMMMAALLASTALSLASVPRAWFDPETVRQTLDLDASHIPLVAVTIGLPG